MKDGIQFKSLMSALGELAGKEISQTLSDMYWMALSEYTDEEVTVAISAGIKKWDCFRYGKIPAPSEIIEIIKGDGEAEALHAWELLQRGIQRAGPYKSVHFLDGRIARVVQILGGWIAVNQWLESELTFRRQEFTKAYRVLPAGGESIVLIGMTERDNAARGFMRNIPPPMVIGDERPKREMLEAPHGAE